MSLSARNWVWETDNRPRIATDTPAGLEDVPWIPLTPAEKLVLLCLAGLESAAEGYAYPSYATIARRTCLNVRTVQRVVKVLGESGLVHVARDRRVDGRWLSCIYRYPAVPEEYRAKVRRGCTNADSRPHPRAATALSTVSAPGLMADLVRCAT
ncbi:helix-turn-helix domain-containing protein [Microbacterium sp.]|jgi:hypothetical protein|uniref:helix-turn-helix domain-containing protein n=1 Tax=Microbacterium sp. TaxID=51671 RepID=UPI0037C775D3